MMDTHFFVFGSLQHTSAIVDPQSYSIVPQPNGFNIQMNADADLIPDTIDPFGNVGAIFLITNAPEPDIVEMHSNVLAQILSQTPATALDPDFTVMLSMYDPDSNYRIIS
jgi:hypothetical protein